MKFIWIKDGYELNTRVVFALDNEKECDTMTVCAVDFFRVKLDGKFTCYGPERTASGFSRPKTVCIKGAKKVEVEVSAYNSRCYACDFQKPFFGVEVKSGDELVYTSDDFIAYTPNSFIAEKLRFSGQRGYVENTDLSRVGQTSREIIEVDAPIIIDEIGDVCKYREFEFLFIDKEPFKGFGKHRETYSETRPNYKFPESELNPLALESEFSSGKYVAYDYMLKEEHTGFISLKISAKSKADIFVVMDEYLPDGKWLFRRSGCNDYFKVTVEKGDSEFLSFEPYSVKYIKILVSGNAEVKPNFISLENDKESCVKVTGNQKFVNIFKASENTFRQNAVDIFMDCPLRERAGWLCDSYFTAKTEQMFFGNNDIERAFIENILISKTDELDSRMFPKCFPSEHSENHYIPNWAMWLVVELKDYLERTGDRSLIDLAKDRVYALIDFFEKYVNEFGLLENLESWVFIEWSVCNTPEYIKGVNFPSNMLFAHMLKAVAFLYDDSALIDRAEKILTTVQKLSFNGKFFIDNADRNENGELVCVQDHISETCQYYALFMGLCPNDEFKETIKNEFGPMRTDAYPEIGRSNMFIGNYLRLMWLCDIGEYDRVVNESAEYFSTMAEKTGTLWEHNHPNASCNHGFASVSAVILLRCFTGFVGVKDKKPVFEEGHKISGDYGVKIEFNY